MQNDKVANLVDKFNGFDIKKKLLAIIMILVVLALGFVAIGNLVGQIMLVFKKDTGLTATQLGLSKDGLPVTTIAFLAILVMAITSFLSTNLRNAVERSENGIHYAKDKSGGTARWMNDAEVKQNFNVGKVQDSTSTIYGKLRQNGNDQVVTYRRPKGAEGNRNTLVIASMGSGKTYTYVINELIQTILRGDSFVCTDPKGELFTTLAQWCSEMGVDVHLLNLDPEHVTQSEFWNCLQETINPETERLDPTKLSDFVNIYMQNSGDGKIDFWYNSALNLVKAATGYVAYEHEKAIVEGYIELYKKVLNKDVADDVVVNEMRNSMCSFKWCKNVIREEALKNNYDLEKVESLIHSIETQLPKYKYNIGEVFDVLLNFADHEADFENIPEWHSARTSYLMYKTNDSESVRQSALQGAQLRFTLFQDPNIKNLLSYDGINLKDINLKQSAYFVIVSDKVDTLKPISSLFFSFFFKDVLDNYDKEKQKAETQGKKNPCLGVTAMLEEFFSIGVIGANPEAFGKTMATCRSRKLYVSIIIQYIAQLEALYGKYIKDSIQGGCATLYYLGGNDPSTLKFISDFAGATTVMTESHQEGASTFSKTGTTVNVSAKSRALVTEEDARQWRNRVLLVKQWCQPAKFYPFGWDNHWICYKGEGNHPKGTIHLIPEEIVNADGTKATLWNVAADSFTSYDEYIAPIGERVKAIKKNTTDLAFSDLKLNIADLEERKDDFIDIAPEDDIELADTELICVDDNTLKGINLQNEKVEPEEKKKASKAVKTKKTNNKTKTSNKGKSKDSAATVKNEVPVSQEENLDEAIQDEKVQNPFDFEPSVNDEMESLFNEMLDEEQNEFANFESCIEQTLDANVEPEHLKENEKGQVSFDLGLDEEASKLEAEKTKETKKKTSSRRTGVNGMSRKRGSKAKSLADDEPSDD
jgi:type IV secretory pathway TraG/TraD family ATPase VirD4